jgi:hypothetical protein
MKYTTAYILSGLLVAFSLITTSCNKTVTEIRTVRDTLVAQSKDTSLPIDVTSWNLYSGATNTIVSPGTSTYFNTSEGIKFLGQAYRQGSRLQTKTEFSFVNKTIYYKWKASGAGLYSDIVPQVKYDPSTGDSYPAIQGVDFGEYSFVNVFNNSTVIQQNVWYYTSIKHLQGSDLFLLTTCTNNYNNMGGILVKSATITVYTKHGYLALRNGDPYGGTNSYVVLGECKIAD